MLMDLDILDMLDIVTVGGAGSTLLDMLLHVKHSKIAEPQMLQLSVY